MGLFSRGNKNNNPTQSEKKSLFGGKTFRPESVEDYRNYSERQLFAQFKSENWNVKEPDDKIAVLQELENREAAAHNRPAAKVVQAYGSSYGGYNSGTHKIEIRLTDNQFEDLDTLFHESEHANQSKSPINSVSFSENDKKLMSVEDMTSSDGIRSHYSKYGSSLYKVMTSELDANNVALEKVSSLKNEYIDEGKYQEYLAGRQEYYDGLADVIDIKSPDKKAALLNTIECAYIRNELSESEYGELKELITNSETYDLCEVRTAEINETLSRVDMQDKMSIQNLSLDRDSAGNMTSDTTSAARQQLAAYMAEHNYGRADFAEYSQDPEWRILHRAAYPDYEMPQLTKENAQRQLTQYMNEHNYGREDYAEYSKDPVWRELHAAAYPDYELPPLNDSMDISDDIKAKTTSGEIEETEDEETEDEESETEDEESETEEETEDEESATTEEETEEEESETEEEETEEESETEESETEDLETEEVEAEEVEVEESETEELETEEVEAEEVEVEESETEELETEEVETEEVEVEESETEELETEEVEAEEVEVEELETEELETEEVEAEEVEAEEVEVEEAETEEVETEELETEEFESEDMDSAMLDDVESEDSGYEEDSVMVEDLDNTEEVTDMENNSEMIDDLDETESVDSSMSESYDYSSSSDGMSSDGGGMDSGGGMDME